MLAVNQVLHNRYRIIRELGAGGMGAVYEAEDNQRFGKKVALKEILLNLKQKNSEHFRLAFEREAKILTQIDHEAVPKVIGYILETNFQVLVMELIEGEDLDKLLERRQKAFPLERVLEWTEQLLDALDYLHTLEQPIIHRDIKPQNLKLTSRGKIKLLDFGIAKDSEVELNQTAPKTMVGATLFYSPIEQIIRIPQYFEMLSLVYPEKALKTSSQPADARSDIYALGATLYHLLSNEFPRPAYLRGVELWAGRDDSLKPLHQVNAEISPEISDVLLKSMAIEREDRFASAKEMQTALQNAISQKKWRKHAEAEGNLLMEQYRIRNEREALEAERLKFAEERQRHQQNQAEAERKRLEQLEYEAKLKEWQSKNVIEQDAPTEIIRIDAMQAPTEILRIDAAQAPTENLSADDIWSDLAETKDLAEPDSPFYSSAGGFAGEMSKTVANTLGNKPQTAPDIPAPAKSKKNPLFWILPIVAALVMLFGIGAFGVVLLVRSFGGDTPENKSVSNTSIALPTNSPTISPTNSPTPTPEPSVSPTAQPSAQPSDSPIKNVSDNEKPKPTVAPTASKPIIVKPSETKPPKTPKPTPTRNNDCIFTGKC